MRIFYQAWGNLWKGKIDPCGFALYPTRKIRDSTVKNFHEIHPTQRAIGDVIEVEIPDEHSNAIFQFGESWRDLAEVSPENIPQYVRKQVYETLWIAVCNIEERRHE